MAQFRWRVLELDTVGEQLLRRIWEKFKSQIETLSTQIRLGRLARSIAFQAVTKRKNRIIHSSPHNS